MISLGLLGLAQALLLPGLLATLSATRNHSVAWQERLLFAPPLSIFLNYALVAALTAARLYTQAVMLAIVAVECALILALFLRAPARSAAGSRADSGAAWRLTIDADASLVRALVKAATLLYLVQIFLAAHWSVFTAWDPIVSWNRWALEWQDQTPGGSWGYPPGLPILFSLVYKLSGTSSFQTMARNVAAFFPFYGLFCLWRIGGLAPRHAWASVLAGVIYAFLLPRGYQNPDFAFSGYADPVIAGLAAFSIYLLALTQKTLAEAPAKAPTPAQRALACLALCAPALIKQSGAFLAVVIAGGVFLLDLRRVREQPLATAALALLTAAATAHWYLYSLVRWHDYVYAASLVDPDMVRRLAHAAALSAQVATLPVLIAFAAGLLLSGTARRLAACQLLPLWLFWAVLVSYDFRTACFFIPVLAAVAALGVEVPIAWFQARRARGRRDGHHALSLQVPIPVPARRGVVALAVAITASLFALPLALPAGRLVAYDTAARLQANDHGFNREADALFASSAPGERTVTCYQPLFNLPHAPGRLVPVDCSLDVPTWLARTDARYLIYWQSSANPARNAETVRAAAREASLDFAERRLAPDFVLYEKR